MRKERQSSRVLGEEGKRLLAEGYTKAQLAEKWGLSRERVSQILKLQERRDWLASLPPVDPLPRAWDAGLSDRMKHVLWGHRIETREQAAELLRANSLALRRDHFTGKRVSLEDYNPLLLAVGLQPEPPEEVDPKRIQAAKNLLEKLGYTVTKNE